MYTSIFGRQYKGQYFVILHWIYIYFVLPVFNSTSEFYESDGTLQAGVWGKDRRCELNLAAQPSLNLTTEDKGLCVCLSVCVFVCVCVVCVCVRIFGESPDLCVYTPVLLKTKQLQGNDGWHLCWKKGRKQGAVGRSLLKKKVRLK